MQKRTIAPVPSMSKNPLQYVFFLLYKLVSFIIFIGEVTQYTILFPFFLIRYVTKQLTSLDIKLPNYSLPTIILPQAKKTQKVKILKKKQTQPFSIKPVFAALQTQVSHTFSHSIKVTQTVAQSIVKVLGKSLANIPQTTVSILKTLFTIVVLSLKTIVGFIKAVVLAIYHSIRAVYLFLVSDKFRYFIYGFIFCTIVAISYQAYAFVISLPSPTAIGKVNFAQSTHMYDRNGKLLYEIYRDISRTPIKLETLPAHVYHAAIAIEDKNFYNHQGISVFGGILRAAKDTIQYNELQGGSTITQQLVKTSLLTPERTLDRKLKEMALALWTERLYSKEQILEMYLNQVPYGGSAYGIEEAAKIYFGKSAKELSISEAALLAGLPQAPSIYSPFINPEGAIRRRNEVLYQMYDNGFITKEQWDQALVTELSFLLPETSINAPHFVFYTKSILEQEYGAKKVEEGGFSVTTSLDLEIQNNAEQILKEELEKIKNLNVTNGGILVMNPQTGEILAMVGSVDYFEEPSGAFNVTLAQRQPGSTLKPMLYAMAMERGMTAASTIDDSPIVFGIPGGEPYTPVNYDGQFHGKVTIRTALANSYNIPAVKTLNSMGVQQFVDFGKNMGIDTWDDSSRFGLSLSLGGGEVTLLDLAQVYGVFASGGYRNEPTSILNITDANERQIGSYEPSSTSVLKPGVSYIISDILSDNQARQQAFGPNSALYIPDHKVAVKTGTTNDKKDNLTVGYTPEFLVAVWVGNNNNTAMNQQLVSGITGAAPIWNRVMQYLLNNKSTGQEEFVPPSDVVGRPCYTNKMEYFVRGTEGSYCGNTIIKPNNQPSNREARNPIP
ncbi:MAG: transglycosylase domain-containing protein [Weeksellaceae bacterium]